MVQEISQDDGVCGEGELVKTVLMVGQVPIGEEID